MCTIKTNLLRLTVATLLMVSVVACGDGSKDKNGLETVSVSTSKNVWSALPLVAAEKGFFEEEGLKAELTYQSAGRYNMDALVSGSVDFATIVEVNLAYLGFTGNQDFLVVASVVESQSFAIVAKRSSGISNPSDLIGKSLAYSPGTGGELFAFRYFEKNNLNNADIDLRKIQPVALQQAVVGGDIDAAATWEPFIYNIARALGTDALIFRDPEAYTGYMNLAVRKQWAQKHPETIRKFIRALRKAETYIQANPDESKALLAKLIGVEINDIEGVWPYFEIGVGLDINNQVTVTSEVAESIKQDQPDFANKPTPDFKPYFDAQYLNGQ